LISQNSKNTSSQILHNHNSWKEKDAELSAKYQIYNTLIKSAVYTQSEGKLEYEMEANKVNFAYVAGLYSTIKTVT
jgi:hypothetical protein